MASRGLEGARHSADKLVEEFAATLGVDWAPAPDLLTAAHAAADGCGRWSMRSPFERKQTLFALINSKLRLNQDRFQEFLDEAAEKGISLNYHEKSELLDCLNNGDRARFSQLLPIFNGKESLFGAFRPISRQETLKALHQQLRTGYVKRKDAKKCDITERRDQVLRALFGSYVFNAFPAEAMHRHFNSDCRVEYLPDFYQHMLRFHGNTLARDCALIFLSVDSTLRDSRSFDELRNDLCEFVCQSYARLANHCFLAILLKPFWEAGEDGQWRLFSDLILYAEKHRQLALTAGYFHPKEIAEATASHIPRLDRTGAKFEQANEGFFFRDCLVLAPKQANGELKTTSDPVDLLLLFEKNERDETLIPCPACRSTNVRGNSYPALGVRSWECQNPICSERSAFDRGNRYSLSSLIKQEAIRSDEDQIPDWSLRKWKLDVIPAADESAVADMLLRHFSLHGDSVLFVNAHAVGGRKHGRRIVYENLTHGRSGHDLFDQFQQSAFFKRFVIDRSEPTTASPSRLTSPAPTAELHVGDCFEILSSVPQSSIDGAVTSPPYYNARSYSEWPNIYCYLYDMYNSARQVFKVLKPGAIYLFNIFDYFDNENSVVFSAMGKKRMILGAYIANLFRRIGFELCGNVVWHKGEIEGKRNFNQGNRSPYYQFPFNCWEHIFVFRKPGDSNGTYAFPQILVAQPVMKMIGGENVLGHSAPFPPAIPELLIAQMRRAECVLDPFSGSMTTARAALQYGVRSLSIEMHKEYCELGLRLLTEDLRNTGGLFGPPTVRQSSAPSEARHAVQGS